MDKNHNYLGNYCNLKYTFIKIFHADNLEHHNTISVKTNLNLQNVFCKGTKFHKI